MDSVWEKVKADLREQIPASNYMMWIEPLDLATVKDNCLVLTCPNYFSKKWIQEYYSQLIQSKVSKIKGSPCDISLEVSKREIKPADRKKEAAGARPKNTETNKKTPPSTQLSLPDMHARPQTGRFLKQDYTFDNFVVGNNNDFAYSAVLSMGSQKNFANRSLFLSSQSGMGKSHLAQALGHHALSHNKGARVYYITAEDFSNEMVNAFNSKSIGRFKEKYRTGFDMLLLDDLHALAGKERTQTEMAMVVDYMLDAGKKVLFTGCCLPGEIPKLNPQLKSRLGSGLVTTMEAPDFRTRVRILHKKCRINGYRIPSDILEYLADNLTADVRQLESGLNGVAMKSSLLGMPVDMNLAESIVRNIAEQSQKISLTAIKKLVCKEYGIIVKDIESRSRKQRLTWPRQVGIFLSRRFTDHSLKSIGRCYNRYHATVIHSINTVESAMRAKQSVRQEIDYLSKKIEKGAF